MEVTGTMRFMLGDFTNVHTNYRTVNTVRGMAGNMPNKQAHNLTSKGDP